MSALSPRRKRIVVGLTGGFGTGKSTVAAMLRSLGAYVIDADELARAAMSPGTTAYRAAVRAVGSRMVRPDGSFDRAALGRAVFRNRVLLKRLNAAVHPFVVRRMKELLRRLSRPVVVLDVPLLFEAGLTGMADVVMVVYAPRAAQVARVRAARRLTRREINERIQCQLPLREKVRRADIVIDNGTTLAHTRKQIQQWWKQNNV